MSLMVDGLGSRLVGPFSFTVPTGSCLAVTGPSGAGKSLLLRMIADLDPHDGRVSADGQDQASLPASEWRRRVGLVPARSGWWIPRIGDHFPAHDDERRRALAADLFLPDALFERDIVHASTGELQRLALIRALLARPRVLLLDEPTGSLDPRSAAAVERVIARTLSEGTTVVMVTHDDAQAARLGHAHLRLDGAC